MSSEGQSLDVLKYEVFCLELHDDSGEMSYQLVSRIVECSLADHREPLARCAAKHDVDLAVPQRGMLPNLVACKSDNAAAYRCTSWEIELMDCSVYWIELYCGGDFKSGLLET